MSVFTRTTAMATAVAMSFALVAGGSSVACASSANPTADEAAFVRDINALRASRGVKALVVDSRLTSMARAFATKMADAGHIYHNPDLGSQAPGDWEKLGENVGSGYDEPGLHQAFVNSSGHFANLVDSEFNAVGVGVLYRNGVLWVVEDFMKSSGTTQQVSPPPTAGAKAIDNINSQRVRPRSADRASRQAVVRPFPSL